MNKRDTIRLGRRIVAGIDAPPPAHCIEYDKELCGKIATHAFFDEVSGTYGTKCKHCSLYYNSDYIEDLSPEMNKTAALKQFISSLLDMLEKP